MSRAEVSPESFGRKVLGPIVAEFSLRLWSLTSLMEHADDACLLFCARGGLRMQLVYERFLAATGLTSPVPVVPFMVSRVVAVRPALMRTVTEGLDELLPVVAAVLTYEFSGCTLREVAVSLSGVEPVVGSATWEEPFTPHGLVSLLRHPDGAAVTEALGCQTELFTRHLHDVLGARRRAVLVDTGLYGTTRDLLASGFPDIEVTSALMARTHRVMPGGRHSRTVGLSVEAERYVPWRRRTALLRYWHFVEWLFEPDLPTVRTFCEVDGAVRSNLEVEGWQGKVAPPVGSPFQGVLDHVDALSPGAARTVVGDAERAWRAFRRAVVWPDTAHGHALRVGTRSHDFGRVATWEEPRRTSLVTVLRSSTMWREGQIARSGSRLRWPVLAAIETAYGVRQLTEEVRRMTRRVAGRSVG